MHQMHQWKNIEEMAPYRSFIEKSLNAMKKAFNTDDIVILSVTFCAKTATFWVAARGTYQYPKRGWEIIGGKTMLSEELAKRNQLFSGMEVYVVYIPYTSEQSQRITYQLFDLFLSDLPQEQYFVEREKRALVEECETLPNAYKIVNENGTIIVPRGA